MTPREAAVWGKCGANGQAASDSDPEALGEHGKEEPEAARPEAAPDSDEGVQKGLAPHWTIRGGKWQTRGSRLSSDEECELDEDDEALRQRLERAQLAASKRAKSGKLKEVYRQFRKAGGFSEMNVTRKSSRTAEEAHLLHDFLMCTDCLCLLRC